MTVADYIARLVGDPPPLTDSQGAVIRAAWHGPTRTADRRAS